MTGDQNVVLVVVDTARAMEAPPADGTVMPTLREVAENGTAYRNAFATAPWTLPSHASLFTGLYPTEHGAHGAHTHLDDAYRTLPEAFADAGYETVAVSNNTWITPTFGFGRGFETFRKGWQYLQSPNDVGTVVRAQQPVAKARAAARTLFRGNPIVNAANVLYSEFGQPSGDDGAARTSTFVDTWLGDRNDDRPFFLFVNHIEPHVEYRPPREHAERFLPDGATFEEALAVRQDPQAYNAASYDLSERDWELLTALYRGELSYVDHHIDRLRQSLRAAGEWDDTVFVVVSDHGENVGEDGLFGHQYNLRETLVHVPFVVRGGAFSRDPGTVDDPVQLTDVAPTLLDEVGVEAPGLRGQCRGGSHHPDASNRREAVFAEHVAPKPSVATLRERFGDLPERLRAFDPPLRAVRTGEYTLVRDASGHETLYRIGPGSSERTEVSATGNVATALGERLDDWVASLESASPSGETSVDASAEARLADLGYL